MTPDKTAMLQRYHNVFGSSEGLLVLGDILNRGHFGETIDPDNKAMIGEYNSAIVIANMAGILDRTYLQLGIMLMPPKE